MYAALLLSTALGSGSLLLPASPEGVGIGDIDGDVRNEIVLLLVWPTWSSVAIDTARGPNLAEIEVKPAIEDRRELWALRFENGALARIAAPLKVGREIVALGPQRPGGPVVVFEDEGVSRIVLLHSAEPTLKLERIANVRSLLAGISTPLGNAVERARLRPQDPPRIQVPTARGVVFLEESGAWTEVDSPFREVRSGQSGSVGIALPRRIDLDHDGRVDLLWLDRKELRAALQHALPDGSFAKPLVWELRALVQEQKGKSTEPARRLVDVLDSDGDGTLEAVIGVQQDEGEGIRDWMKLMRGVPGEYRFFPLLPQGVVAKEASARLAIDGHAADFEHPEGWDSPFRDLDGDGRPELLTLTTKLGYFAIARAALTRSMRVGVVFHVYRYLGGAFREVSDAAPVFEFTADLEDLDSSRFARMPGDLDGDSRTEMVQVAGREVQIHAGLPGARFAEHAGRVLRFEDKIRDFLGLLFVDLDGDGRSELIGFEEQPREEDRPARAVRMEVRTLEGE